MGMRKIADVTGRLMVVDTNVDPDVDGPYWQLNVAEPGLARLEERVHVAVAKRGGPRPSSSPLPRGSRVLLEFLGFEEVARLLPKPELHKRYTSGKRVTYVAMRTAD